MNDRPIGERVAALEVGLTTHIQACEKKHDRNFRVQLVVLGGILAVVAKIFWPA